MKIFNDGAVVGWELALNQVVFDRDNFKSTFSTFPHAYLCKFPILVNTMSWWVLFKSKSYFYFLTNMLNFILSRTDWWPCTNCSFNWSNLVMQIISWAYYGQLTRMVNRMYETEVGVTSSIDFRPAFIDFGYFVAQISYKVKIICKSLQWPPAQFYLEIYPKTELIAPKFINWSI